MARTHQARGIVVPPEATSVATSPNDEGIEGGGCRLRLLSVAVGKGSGEPSRQCVRMRCAAWWIFRSPAAPGSLLGWGPDQCDCVPRRTSLQADVGEWDIPVAALDVAMTVPSHSRHRAQHQAGHGKSHDREETTLHDSSRQRQHRPPWTEPAHRSCRDTPVSPGFSPRGGITHPLRPQPAVTTPA